MRSDTRTREGARRRGPNLKVDPATSARLGWVRQRDTKPERLVREILRAAGVRYRVRNRDLPGSPDVAHRAARWAVFVHGCFWHAHRGCSRATVPKRNRAFWLAKFAANVERDALAIRDLQARGFRVGVVWECELERRPTLVERRLRRLVAYTRGKRAS